MKRIIIICEGHTEKEFCKDVLFPHFNQQNILIETPLIKKSGDGIVNWKIMKKQIETHLKQDNSAFVSSLIDYYGINEKHEFPEWKETLKIQDKNQRLEKLENAMKNDLEESYRFRYIPYIQLHEFEGLLFCEKKVFDANFKPAEFIDYNYLIETLESFANPEDINDGKTTAPSKRLKKIISGYNKPTYGSLIAQEIGLEIIMKKCYRFKNWIDQLEKI
jgi:hypothetical protein